MSALTHTADCACVRCAGFAVGNTIAVKHNAYQAKRRLWPEILARADELRPLAPWLRPADEGALLDYVEAEFRAAFAQLALDQVDDAAGDNPLSAYVSNTGQTLDRLRNDHRRWLLAKRQLGNDLGFSPMARERLKLNAALSEDAATRALARHLAQKDGES